MCPVKKDCFSLRAGKSIGSVCPVLLRAATPHFDFSYTMQTHLVDIVQHNTFYFK